MSTSSRQLYSTLQEFHGRDDVECQISARLAAADTIITLIGYTYKGNADDTASFIRYVKGLRGYYEGLYTADGVTFFDDGVFIEIALKGTPTDVCGRYMKDFRGSRIVCEDALLAWEESDVSVSGVREMLKELGIEEAPHRDRTVCGKCKLPFLEDGTCGCE